MKPPFLLIPVLALVGCTAAPAAKDDYRASYAKYQAARNAGTCHVHRTPLKKETVPIQYGLPAASSGDPDTDVRMKQFPFSRQSPMGGCEVTPDAPKTAEVSVCSDCVAAEKAWRAARTR